MTTATARDARRDLRRHANAKRAAFVKGYFRTGAGGARGSSAPRRKRSFRRSSGIAIPEGPRGARGLPGGPGEYGEGDEFIGVTMPDLRAVAKRFRGLVFGELSNLLDSPTHEDRLLALAILADRSKRADAAERRAAYDFFVKKRRRVNNWDLVDVSAPYVVGPLLDGPGRALVERLSRSSRLWDRRIAVVAHQHEIRRGNVAPFLRFAPRFLVDAGGGGASSSSRGRRGVLVDEEDLMHKAVGWMLRECGDRDRAALQRFLRSFANRMPSTMLRYAIEKMPVAERKRWMARRPARPA